MKRIVISLVAMLTCFVAASADDVVLGTTDYTATYTQRDTTNLIVTLTPTPADHSFTVTGVTTPGVNGKYVVDTSGASYVYTNTSNPDFKLALGGGYIVLSDATGGTYSASTDMAQVQAAHAGTGLWSVATGEGVPSVTCNFALKVQGVGLPLINGMQDTYQPIADANGAAWGSEFAGGNTLSTCVRWPDNAAAAMILYDDTEMLTYYRDGDTNDQTYRMDGTYWFEGSTYTAVVSIVHR